MIASYTSGAQVENMFGLNIGFAYVIPLACGFNIFLSHNINQYSAAMTAA